MAEVERHALALSNALAGMDDNAVQRSGGYATSEDYHAAKAIWRQATALKDRLEKGERLAIREATMPNDAEDPHDLPPELVHALDLVSRALGALAEARTQFAGGYQHGENVLNALDHLRKTMRHADQLISTLLLGGHHAKQL